MTRQEYNDYRGWELPADEDGSDEGYLVEYVGGGQPNMPDKHKGYISWSPRDVFESSYQSQLGSAAPSRNDMVTEDMIKVRGLDAPRASVYDLHESISDVELLKHTTSSGSVLRFAILVLKNGFSVTGRPSVSASPENDNEDIGVKIAVENAVHELWPFMGFKIVQSKHDNS